MDLGFFRRAEARFASRTPARLDFPMLLAALRAERSASPWREPPRSEAAATRVPDPLAEILLAGPRWREAVAIQRGSFNPRLAAKGAVNRNDRPVYLGVSAFLQRPPVKAVREAGDA